MLKAIGYVALGIVALVMAIAVLGMLADTIGGLFYWLRYDGLPGLVTLGIFGLIGYGIWKIAFGPD
ncbi:MAG: hypothetical protein AAFR24_06680 [Cyanobacteria bacterium J06627_3]